MSQIGELSVRIGADTQGIKKGLSEVDGMSKRTAASMSAVKTAIAGAFTVSALTMFTKHLIDVSDTYTQLNGRLTLVTKSTQELKAAQSGLYEIAKTTRVEYESTVDLYTRMARSTDQLGVSQEDLLQITESINKALVVSGASGESASAALMQLGQGFAAGALRGEELNSVLEQTPRLAQMIADGMGITIGQLRQYGQEGKLSAEAVTKAILSQGKAINAEFDKMPVTVGQAMTNLNTIWESIVSGGNAATGATNDLATAITSVATTIEQNREGIIQALVAIGEAAGWLIERIANVGNAVALIKSAASGKVSWIDAATASPEDARKLLAGVSPTAGHSGSWGGGASGSWGDTPPQKPVSPVYSPKVVSGRTSGPSLSDRMDDLRKDLATEAEIEAESYAKRIKLIEEFYAGRADLTMEDDELRAKVAAEYEERMAEINGIPAMERGLEELQDSFKAERELELERYQEKLDDLQEYLDNKVVTEEEYRGLRERLEAEHQTTITDLEKKANSEKLAAAQSFFNSMASMQAGQSKALLAVQKAAAVASAVISAKESVVHAYDWGMKVGGPPLATAFAVAAGVAQAANIAAIASAGSSSSTSSYSSGAQTITDAAGNTSSQSVTSNRTVTVYGLDKNSLFSGEQVAELLNEFMADGGKLNIR